MTPAEFIQLANQRTDVEMVRLCLHEDSTPYVFESVPPKWDAFREFIAPKLQVAKADIVRDFSRPFGTCFCCCYFPALKHARVMPGYFQTSLRDEKRRMRAPLSRQG
jgi:hypothetical protein